MKIHSRRRDAFSFVELIAALAIMGLLLTAVLPRLFGEHDSATAAACHTHKGDIEIQAELWMFNTGTWPAADLSNIGGNLDYFTDGLPTCPVDQTSYTIDTSTGRIIGHNH